MLYLAANGIVHTDLSARNILVRENHFGMELKIASFAYAQDGLHLTMGTSKLEQRINSNDVYWMAPELIQLQQPSISMDSILESLPI